MISDFRLNTNGPYPFPLLPITNELPTPPQEGPTILSNTDLST